VAKSAFLSAMIASAIQSPVADETLTFGVKASNSTGKVVIHFDTEQSRYDHFALVSGAARRAGVEMPPEILRSFCLTDVNTWDRREMLRLELARSAARGVFAVFLDGAADFVIDVNDTEESFGFVEMLHGWAILYNCVIVCVLHENPGSEYAKTRGHLGSQLERKAETNLRLQKDKNGVTTIWSDKARHCSFPKEEGILISYDAERGLHVLDGSAKESKASAKRDDLKALAATVFAGKPGVLSWTGVRDRVATVVGIGESGARKKFEAMLAAGVVVKNSGERYELSSETPHAP